MAERAASIIPIERIQQCIYLIRGHKVLLDSDLARLYEVETKVLSEMVMPDPKPRTQIGFHTEAKGHTGNSTKGRKK